MIGRRLCRCEETFARDRIELLGLPECADVKFPVADNGSGSVGGDGVGLGERLDDSVESAESESESDSDEDPTSAFIAVPDDDITGQLCEW